MVFGQSFSRICAVTLVSAALLVAAGRSASGVPSGVTRVSVSSSGGEGSQPSSVHAFPQPGSISADGRYVVFSSASPEFTPGDTNSALDVFVHDRSTGGTTKVSVASDGAAGNGPSFNAIISSTGRFIVFGSRATNLSPVADGLLRAYVHDRDTDADGVFDEPGAIKTVMVSVKDDGTVGGGSDSGEVRAITPDGRFVLIERFGVAATYSVVVHDRDADADGVYDEPGGILADPVPITTETRGVAISDDGRHVIVTTFGVGDPGDTNGNRDAYAYDRQLGTFTPLTFPAGGPSLPGGGEARDASSDLRFVVVTTPEALVAEDTNGNWDLYVHDRDTDADGTYDEPGHTADILVSVATDGFSGNAATDHGAISPDGSLVAFHTRASNLGAGDTQQCEQAAPFPGFPPDLQNCADVYVRNLNAWTTSRLSLSHDGAEGIGDSTFPSVSDDGTVVYMSTAGNLVPDDTNGVLDVFASGSDTEPPIVTCEPTPTFTLGESGATVSAMVDDGGSGPLEPVVSTSVSTNTVGSFTASLTGEDNAGNTTTIDCPYVVAYDFEGFFAPVNNPPVRNDVQAGTAIPVKFSLGGDQGLDIFATGSPTSHQIYCDSGTPIEVVEQTVTAGSSSLSYGGNQYTYVWKTKPEWSDQCRELTVTLDDGTSHTAIFQFR